MLRRALEHQMLEEMREPGLARRLVGGADLVPDHLGHHRRAVILDHHDLQAVRQREGRRRLGGEGGLGGRAGCCEHERSEQGGNKTVLRHHDLYERPHQRVRVKSAASYTVRRTRGVTKPRESDILSAATPTSPRWFRLYSPPYFPAAGLYSLFIDSFGPV